MGYQMGNENKPACLGHIGDDATQLCEDYDIQI